MATSECRGVQARTAGNLEIESQSQLDDSGVIAKDQTRLVKEVKRAGVDGVDVAHTGGGNWIN